jgi:hypothetical protein
MTILSRNSLTEVFRNADDFDLSLAAREVIILKDYVTISRQLYCPT